MKLANRLRMVRDSLGKSQMQVSKDTGINNKTLSGYERGVSEPDLGTIKLLAEYYSVSVDYLLSSNGNLERTSNLSGSDEPDKLSVEIDSLSNESKEELEKYIQFLKMKDDLDKSKEGQSCTLGKDA